MNIEEFYDGDSRRRSSSETELGDQWTDKTGLQFELNWVHDTGEVYVMSEPAPVHEWEDPFGGIHIGDDAEPVSGLQVIVVGQVASHAELEQIFDGWTEAMFTENSTSWIAERLREAGSFVGP